MYTLLRINQNFKTNAWLSNWILFYFNEDLLLRSKKNFSLVLDLAFVVI